MNPQIKEQWIKALRSGEYKQDQGVLHNPETNGFCCLGVLQDLYNKSKEVPRDDPHTGICYPSFSCTTWADLPLSIDNTPEGTVYVACHLAQMNDVKELTFLQIADWIEKNL